MSEKRHTLRLIQLLQHACCISKALGRLAGQAWEEGARAVVRAIKGILHPHAVGPAPLSEGELPAPRADAHVPTAETLCVDTGGAPRC